MNLSEDWFSIAQKELGGKNPEKTLTKQWDQFQIKPFYRKSDVEHAHVVAITDRQRIPYGAPNHWFNLPEVDCSSTTDKNSMILEHLQNGADGIVLAGIINSDPEKLLQDVKPEFCFLGFEANHDSLSFFEKLEVLFGAEQLHGALYWNWTGKPHWLPVANLFKGYESFRCFGIHESGSGAVEQLTSILNNTIVAVDVLTDFAFSARSVFNQLAFTLHSTADFFGDIIRVRALRILLSRLARAYGLDSVRSFIRMKINPLVSEQYQPHGDLLAEAFATISALTSSVDAVTVIHLANQSGLHRRTVRNISLLLKEESKLDKVIDPLAGSYFVETLTSSLVEKVWNQITTR